MRGGAELIDITRWLAATVGATGCSDGCADGCSFCDRRNRLRRRSPRVYAALVCRLGRGAMHGECVQRASQILRCFLSGDHSILCKAIVVYVRPMLEYCSPVWSPALNLVPTNWNLYNAVSLRLTGLRSLSIRWTSNCTWIRTAGIKTNLCLSHYVLRSCTVLLTFSLILSLSSLIVIVHEGIHWNCCILMRELTLVLIHFLYVLCHFGTDCLLLLY